MKKEFQDKLYKGFPLLYRDRNKPMTQTAMCWGIDCDDGWFDLLYDLSDKLEEEIKRLLKEDPHPKCACCGCKAKKHYGYLSSRPGKCLAVHKNPRYTTKIKRKYSNNLIPTFFRLIDRIMGLFIYDYETCWCDAYDPSIPRASQVKEKYGGLRVYLTQGTNKMFDDIHEAEMASEKICEICGKDGQIKPSGWLKCLCEDCEG